MRTTSVIIPTWNGAPLIADCLRSIVPQLRAGDELIVVDNGSTDGTPDLIERAFPTARLIRLDRNLGFAGGVNRGLAAAAGDTLILINQDVALREDCLDALRARLFRSGSGIVGGKLLYPDGKTIQHAGGVIIYPRAEADHRGYRQVDDGRWDAVSDVDYVTGALFALDRVVLRAIGLFDEGYYPAYYEEVDYCFRARAAGFAVVYDPAAVAVHHESLSLESSENPARQWAMERGRLRFVQRNYTAAQVRDDFMPAERAYLAQVPPSYARAILAPVYFESMVRPALPGPGRTQAVDEWLRAALDVAAGLSALYVQAKGRVRMENDMSASIDPAQLAVLSEHDFRSSVPVIGPLIQSVRRALYGLTARWGVLSVIHQQTRVNQTLLEYLHEYEARLIEQDRDLAHLSRIVAELEIRQQYWLHRAKAPASASDTGIAR